MKMGKYFPLWERRGYHVLPVHFYTPIPSAAQLTTEVLQNRSDMVGIDLRPTEQLALLERFSSTYSHVYDSFPVERTTIPYQYFRKNAYLSPVDAITLYGMVRHYKPSRILEVGSGFSTYVSAQAIRDSHAEGVETELIAIEPYPNPVLQAGFDGLSQLMSIPVQKASLSLFEALKANDILFIDSTHALKTGSDVQRIYLEILPRLQPGVVVHVHDVFLPYEYPEEWVLKNHTFWNEQYLLQAFLSGRDDFEVLHAVHYLMRDYPEQIQKAWNWQVIPGHQRSTPFVRSTSFWFRRKP
jgi:predicted O-methyltransferase YrrM